MNECNILSIFVILKSFCSGFFVIFAGRGAILWTGMSEVVRRRIFRVYSDVSDFILKGNGNRKKIC